MTLTRYVSSTPSGLVRRRVIAAAAFCLATAASAQMPGPAQPGLSRAAVLADLRATQAWARWDEAQHRWIPHEGVPAVNTGPTRASVKADFAATRRSSHWDDPQGEWLLWVPVARSADAPSRADVSASTQRFLRTHDWDAASQTWSLHGHDAYAPGGLREP